MYLSSLQTITVMFAQLHVSIMMIKMQLLPVVQCVFLKEHALLMCSHPGKGIANYYWH